MWRPNSSETNAPGGTSDSNAAESAPVHRLIDDSLRIAWIEQDAKENLSAIDYRLRMGLDKTVRDAIDFHIKAGL